MDYLFHTGLKYQLFRNYSHENRLFDHKSIKNSKQNSKSLVIIYAMTYNGIKDLYFEVQHGYLLQQTMEAFNRSKNEKEGFA